MSKLPAKILISLATVVLALCLVSQARADETYVFTNTSNHDVTLYLNYPNSVQIPPTAVRQQVLKAGQSWSYTMNPTLPNVRIDLAGGTWKDYKGTVFFIGTNPGANKGGTYTIK